MARWKCPKCGSSDGVIFNARVGGWVQRIRRADGGEEQLHNDHEWMRDPKMGDCASCGKRVPLPPEQGC